VYEFALTNGGPFFGFPIWKLAKMSEEGTHTLLMKQEETGSVDERANRQLEVGGAVGHQT
jgi:hypothetical protein